MVYLGIDPGVTGGMAVLDANAKVLIITGMPQTAAARVNFLQFVLGRAPGGAAGMRAALELVHSSPQMGVRSAFTFGQVYGQLQMMLAAANVAYISPRPQAWQKAMKCLSRGDKGVTLRAARKLFRDQVVITHATADALLLAEFCRRQFVNRSPRSSNGKEG